MAKKQKLELDDFGFSDGLDVPNFNFDSQDVKDDRKPIGKLGKGIAHGFKDSTMSPAFIKNMMRKALPRGYGSAMDFTDQTAGSLKNLYNNSAKELKPAINELKKVTKRAMPTLDKTLPKGVSARLRKWAEQQEGISASASAADKREAAIMGTLGDIFKTEQEQKVRDDQESFVKDKLKEGIEQSRHRDMLGQLDSMRVSLTQMQQYQAKVVTGYQRKSLELQYRHYFVAMDSLEEQKRMNAVATENLAAITKNTGLPDFVKLRTSESIKEAMRNRFIGALGQGAQALRKDFMKKFIDNIGNGVKEKVSAFGRNVQQGAMAADSLMELQEMQNQMGGSGLETAGGMIGGGLSDTLGGSLGKHLGKKLKKYPGVAKWGNKLQYGVDNAPQMIGEWARSNKGEKGDFGWRDQMLQFIKDAATGAIRPSTETANLDHTSNMQEPAVYNRQANKSVTEIIPGFLSRIYQELQMMRTGATSMELVTYDLTSNKFSKSSAARSNLFKTLIDGDSVESTKGQLDSLLNSIDPSKKLSKEKRLALAKQLLGDNLNNREGSRARYTKASTFDGPAGKFGEEFAELFQKYFSGDNTSLKENSFNSDYNNLGSYVGESNKAIQDAINQGDTIALAEMGLIDPRTGKINREKINDYHSGNAEYGKPARKGKSKIPGFAKGGQHKGGARIVGEEGEELEVTGPARYYTKQETQEMLTKASSRASRQNQRGLKTLNDTLVRIEARLNAGTIVYNAESAPSSLFGKGWDTSLRQAGKDIFSLGSKGVSRVKGAVNTMLGEVPGMLKWGADKAVEIYDTVKNKVKDVYVGAEKSPRLQAWKLKAGLYRDELTGKTISTYKDITGAVRDFSNGVKDGTIVLSAEEAKQAFTKSSLGRKLISTLGSVINTAQDLMGGVFTVVPALAKSVFNFVRDKLNEAQDVFTKAKPEAPTLMALTMKAGGYRSAITGKEVRSLKDIDGPVLNHLGQQVLSAEDFAAGLYDRKGRILRTGIDRLKGALGGGVGAVWGALKKGGSVLSDAAKGAWAQVKGVFGGWAGKDGIVFAGGKKMNSTLVQIRDILNERLPGGKRKILGDSDGDGIREGSYEDIMRKRAGSVKGAIGRGAAALAEKGKGVTTSLMDRIKSLREQFGGGGGIDIDIGGDRDSRRKKKLEEMKNRGKPKGLWGKTKGLMGRGMGAVGRGLGGAMGMLGNMKGGIGGAVGAMGLNAAADAATASGHDTIGKGLGMASTAAGVYGAGSMAASLMGFNGLLGAGSLLGGAGLGSTLLAGGGAVLGGLGALLASPVVLGALAVGALGAGAYYGYKYLTSKSLGMLSKVRYAQYGFLPTDTDNLQKVFGLEDKVLKCIKWSGGSPSIDEAKIDAPGWSKDFGVDMANPASSTPWIRWFALRFKPVFLTHLAALKGAEPEATGLGSVDSMKYPAKRTYYANSKFAEGPYSVMDSPTGKALAAGPSEVAAVVATADAEVAKEEKTSGSETGLSKTGAVAMGGAAAAVAMPDSDIGAGLNVSADQASGISVNPLTGLSDSGMGSAGDTTLMATGTMTDSDGSDKLSALDSIRYKTYGLREMTPEKVRALQATEKAMTGSMSFSGSQAVWKGSPDDVLAKVGSFYGIEGGRNNKANVWKAWFKLRFAPVYLNYLSALKAQTGKESASAATALKPAGAVEVAMATYTSTGEGGSVWQVSHSPWPGYTLNDDIKSVESNLQALKEQAKSTAIPQTEGSSTSLDINGGDKRIDKPDAAGSSASAADKAASGEKPGIMARAADTVKSAWESVKSGVSNLFGGAKDSSKAASGGSGGSGMNGGSAINHPGAGTGGDVNALPVSQGDGSYAAHKDLIAAASKMVGVDESLMTTMAAIESGFRATVKAGTSSATGLYQFISGTWKTMLRKYGAKYGIAPDTPATDPRANALMGAEFIKENAEALKKSVSRPLTDTDLYIAHFMGAGGAKKFLSADPGEIAANFMPEAARANTSIFYSKDGRPLTVGEVYQVINGRVRSKGKQYGLNSGNGAPMADSGGKSSTPAEVLGSKDPASKALPVSDMTAAPSAKSTPAREVGAPSAGPSPSSPDVGKGALEGAADYGAAAAGGGFQPNAMSQRSRDVTATAQSQREAAVLDQAAVGATLDKSLMVQTDTLSVLRQILQAVESGSGGRGQPAAGAAENQRAVEAAVGPRPMTRAPVSMAKG
jgi:Transglycosylase SLT domain